MRPCKDTKNFLKNQHRVAVGAEAIALLLGHLVGVHDGVVAAEGRHHHQLRGVGQVEVRDHGVGHREVVGVEDELVGPPLHGLDHAVGRDGRLERAHHRRADGDHLVAAALGVVDRLGRLLRDEELLGVHLVLREVLDVDRAEVAQTHVERDEGAVDPP